MDSRGMQLILPHMCITPYTKSYWIELRTRLLAFNLCLEADTFLSFVRENMAMHSYQSSSSALKDESSDGRMHKYLALARSISLANACTNDLLLEGFVEDLRIKWQIDFISVLRVAIDLVLLSESIFSVEDARAACSSTCLHLSRRQVACLLGHMLLCTLLRTCSNKSNINFYDWLTSDAPTCRAYLTVLCQYLQVYVSYTDSQKEQIIYFLRVSLHVRDFPDWKSLSEALSLPAVFPAARIGDARGHVEIVFANKDIGFGCGGTQEEILFAMSPESCVAVLFTETLKDNEALLIRGAEKTGLYEGYGLSVRYTGCCSTVTHWGDRVIVAIDAQEVNPELRFRESLLFQLEEKNLLRELNKAYVGFIAAGQGHNDSSERQSLPTMISTGAWGCGAFAGDLYLKSLVQFMAAAAAGVSLTYNAFGNAQFADELESFCFYLTSGEVTVASMWREIKAYESYVLHAEDNVTLKTLFQWLFPVCH